MKPGPLRFLPVVDRELRIAARGKATYRWRTWVVALGLGLMALVTFSLTADRGTGDTLGRSLFYALVGVSCAYAFAASGAVTADSVSREKRDGTLGLLFLTDLRGADIILGKLAASSLNTAYGLLGLMPLLAIPVMVGGVTIGAGVLAMLSVLNLMFVSMCVGIFVSTISWDERRATFAAVMAGGALCLAPFLMSGMWIWLMGRGSWTAILLSGLSPLVPLTYLVPSPGGAPEWSPFVLLLPSHLAGWGLLVLAGLLVQRAWHSRSGSPVRRTVDERVFTPRDPVARQGHRRRMLDVHPLVWLLERHPGKRFYADGLVLSIIAIWVWGYRTYGTQMFGGPTWFLIMPLAFAVHLILSSWVVAEASMRILEDRRSGALELLLCTSMSDRELIRGYRTALRRLFLRPVLLMAAAEVYVAFNGFGVDDDESSRNGRWMMLGMAGAILLDTHALSWIALRLAVALPNVNRVGIYALAVTPLGPALVTAVLTVGLGVMSGDTNAVTFPRVVALWFSMVVIVNLVVGLGVCRRTVLREFREAVARVQPRAAVGGTAR